MKRALVEPSHPRLSVVRQCDLLGLSRSAYYYEPAEESQENLHLMRLLDEQYLRTPFYGTPFYGTPFYGTPFYGTPFYGSRKMTEFLRQQGFSANRKRIQRLMRLMGLEAIYPGPKTSQAHPPHRVYPYGSIPTCSGGWRSHGPVRSGVPI